MKVILQTERLVLRELTPDDLPFVQTLLFDEEVMRFYPQRYTEEDARQWLERQRDRYARDGHGFWLVAERDSGASVGQVGLVRHLVEGEYVSEIGYLIHRPYWRQGYASEAAAGVRDYAFGVLGRSVVSSMIRPFNHPSRGVARKIGMKPVKLTVFAGLEHLIHRLSRSGTKGDDTIGG